MPVVELSLSRLQKLIGKNTNKKQILDSLPFLGLDIESLGRNIVRENILQTKNQMKLGYFHWDEFSAMKN